MTEAGCDVESSMITYRNVIQILYTSVSMLPQSSRCSIYSSIKPLLLTLTQKTSLKVRPNPLQPNLYHITRQNPYYSSLAEKMPHAKAVVAGRTIAETDDYEIVEGNVYVRTLTACLLREFADCRSSHRRMKASICLRRHWLT